MAIMNAAQDQNQIPALLLHTGTAGTAETVRAIADTDGNLMVNIAAGETINIGTLNLGTVDIAPLSGVVLSGSLGVGTTATALPASALANRKSMIVYNSGTSRISLGGSVVGTLTGLPLGTADYSPSMDLGTTILYGIADTEGGSVITLEVS